MKAVILLGHGSRIPDAGEDMEKVASLLQQKYALDLVKSCYLSRLGPHFPETLANCASQGARKIIVIPYFLNMGIHLRKDIPEMINAEAKAYPDIKIIFGKHIGYDDSLADIIYKRITASAQLPDIRKTDHLNLDRSME